MFKLLVTLMFWSTVSCAQLGLPIPENKPFLEGNEVPNPSLDFPQQFSAADASDEPDSGNWYEKLRWWKEAKRVYTEDIKDAVEQLLSVEQEYNEKKKIILPELEKYSSTLPLSRVQAPAFIDTLLEENKKLQEEAAIAQTKEKEKERVVESADLVEQQKMLEALKLDFEQFNTLAQREQEALDKVLESQIQAVRNYDERALSFYEKIENILDDHKAHEYFEQVENSLENIRAINNYLRGPLLMFVEQTWAHLQQMMPKITKQIEEIEQKGILVRPLTDEEKAAKAAFEKKRQEARLKADKKRKADEEWKQMAWWKKIFYSIGYFFKWLWESILGMFSYFSATSTQVIKPDLKKGAKKDNKKVDPVPVINK